MPKISELPLANKLKEEDYIPIVQDGVTKKVKGTHFVTEEEYSLDAFSPTIVANGKAMYKFGEGDSVDFSDSAYDGAYKSAILKGQTLVNLWGDGGTKNIEPNNSVLYKNSMFKTSTKYIIKFNILQSNSSNKLMLQYYNDGQWIINDYLDNIKLGLNSFIVTSTSSDFNVIRFFYPTSYGTETVIINDIMIVEYQEGMKNWDIPYFEGMKSVRMPVLTTTGKNLCNNNFIESNKGRVNEKNGLIYQDLQLKSTVYVSGYINIKGLDYITLSPRLGLNQDGTDGVQSYAFYNKDKVYLQGGYNKTTLSVPENAHFFRVTLDSEQNFQLEHGTEATSYEPYKSNILSTLESVELGSIGDVKDTLNLLTGEVVNNFNEVVLNGEEDWRLQTDSTELRGGIYRLSISDISTSISNTKTNCISDKAKSGSWTDILNTKTDKTFAILQNQQLRVQFDGTVEELKEWLKETTPTVKYIKEKVVKTVDLSGIPFGYKGGHIIKSSADGSLLPKFEYEVAVSRGAQISQNTSTLIKHDEKITELLKKTAATYINQKAEIAYLLNMSSTLEEVQTIPFIEDDYVNDDCMVDSDMVMDNMEVEPEKEIIDNVDTLLINLIYDLIELNDTLDLSEKVELFRQSGLIDKHNYEIIKEKLNPTFKEEDYAGINQ